MADQEEVFQQLIEMHLRSGGRPTGKMPEWLYPWAQEKTYAKKLREFLKGLYNPFLRRLFEELPRWVERANRGDSLKMDTWDEEFEQAIREFERTLEAGFEEQPEDDGNLYPAILAAFLGVNKFNGKQWEKATKRLIGQPFRSPEDWANKVRRQWAAENYRLIKSLSREGIKTVNQEVYRGVQEGLSVGEIKGNLRKKINTITESRANLIARDQVGKLNGRLTQLRQEEAGISMYTWRTAHDERVRGRPGGKYPKAIPSHWAMEGVLCKWRDSGVYSEDEGESWKRRAGKMPLVHPGQAINCRCSAIPYVKEKLAEAKENTKEEQA